jgi:hypothetical protein
MVPKAGLEPARAWPTTPSSSACYFPQHIKITQLFEILPKNAYLILSAFLLIFAIFNTFLPPFFRQNQEFSPQKSSCLHSINFNRV